MRSLVVGKSAIGHEGFLKTLWKEAFMSLSFNKRREGHKPRFGKDTPILLFWLTPKIVWGTRDPGIFL